MTGALLHNLLAFVHLLRNSGVDADPQRAHLLVRAIEQVGLKRRLDFFHAARTSLVTRREDLPLFDRLFAAFWRKTPHSALPDGIRARRLIRLDPAACADFPASRGRRYSAAEAIRAKDFGELSEPEFEAVKQLIGSLTWRLGQRHSRRYRVGAGQRLDQRRSLRANLGFGGEWLLWAFRKPKLRPRPLVVIADISGSMEPYTRLLLHFAYGLARGLDQPVEVFVFATRLSRITRPLKNKQIEAALQAVSAAVPDWSGGTRIGKALRAFNLNWGRRVLSRGAIVAIISDGLDRGDIELLSAEMARLQRSCYRLIWLNPLLGSPGYQPLAQGMRAALPYIDDFLSIHDFESVLRLSEFLRGRSQTRPVRPQHLRYRYSQPLQDA